MKADKMIPEPRVNILLGDDRSENLLALEGILDAPDYHLVKAASGREALRCLLDVQMPAMDGIETAQLIKQRKQSQDIPIIFISAISKEEKYVFAGYAAGAVDYLLKPFEPAILKAKVEVFVNLYKINRQLRKQLEREIRVLEQLVRPAATGLTAQMVGPEPLRRQEVFNEMTEEYGQLLDLALEQQVLR
jgi:response regulator RpfG family c-di-GMP phosphodiesterase